MRADHLLLPLLLTGLLAGCSDDSHSVDAHMSGPPGGVPTGPGDSGEGSAAPHGSLPPETLLEIAQRHMNEGKADAAIGHLDLALESDPENAILWATRATAHSALGEPAAALGDIQQAVGLDPHNPGMLTNRGQIYRSFNRDGEALADYEAALVIEPGYYPALFNRGVLHFNEGRNEQALADFGAAIEVQPETAGAWYNRAFVHEALGDLDAAEADMQAFLERNKNPDFVTLGEMHISVWRDGLPEGVEPAALPPKGH